MPCPRSLDWCRVPELGVDAVSLGVADAVSPGVVSLGVVGGGRFLLSRLVDVRLGRFRPAIFFFFSTEGPIDGRSIQ